MKTVVQKMVKDMAKDVDEDKKVISFVATKEVEDRHGDIVRVDGVNLENFKKNPVFLSQHSRGKPPIGRAVSWEKSGDELIIDVEFDEEDDKAMEVYSKYRRGYMNAVSVGFSPLKVKRADDDEEQDFSRFDFRESDLMELSAVSVPANPEATDNDAKSQKMVNAFEESGILVEEDKSPSSDEMVSGDEGGSREANEPPEDNSPEEGAVNIPIKGGSVKEVSEAQESFAAMYSEFSEAYGLEYSVKTQDEIEDEGDCGEGSSGSAASAPDKEDAQSSEEEESSAFIRLPKVSSS